MAGGIYCNECGKFSGNIEKDFPVQGFSEGVVGNTHPLLPVPGRAGKSDVFPVKGADPADACLSFSEHGTFAGTAGGVRRNQSLIGAFKEKTGFFIIFICDPDGKTARKIMVAGDLIVKTETL